MMIIVIIDCYQWMIDCDFITSGGDRSDRRDRRDRRVYPP